jgi:hypothetical protein
MQHLQWTNQKKNEIFYRSSSKNTQVIMHDSNNSALFH